NYLLIKTTDPEKGQTFDNLHETPAHRKPFFASLTKLRVSGRCSLPWAESIATSARTARVAITRPQRPGPYQPGAMPRFANTKETKAATARRIVPGAQTSGTAVSDSNCVACAGQY